MLECDGSRCCTSTKAHPLSRGMLRSSSVTASSPPAEAPIPTMRKGDLAVSVEIAPFPGAGWVFFLRTGIRIGCALYSNTSEPLECAAVPRRVLPRLSERHGAEAFL